jgi:tetrapyrrole methylase family protein / MazG family protein
MDDFNKLLSITDRLLGPGGCPWDQQQTLRTLETYLLEEAHELIEAIDSNEAGKIVEELGDVLFTLVFIGKIGEKEKLFSFDQAVRGEIEKLIRRHPHIFAEKKVESVDDVLRNWEAIKKEELEKKGRKTILDGIPATLPALSRAQKVIEKLKRSKSPLAPKPDLKNSTEEEIGERLWHLVAEANCSKVDAESALRRYSAQVEKKITGD